MPQRGTLKIHSEGGLRLADVAELLVAIDDTYNALYVFERLLDSISRYERRGYPPFFVDFPGSPFRLERRFRMLREWPPDVGALRTAVTSRDRLQLKSVELHSPGFWEVLGSLNPLEVIRKSVNDAHERRKDRQYREAAEKERLDLENRLLRTKLLEKEIEVARSIGATEDDFAPLRNALVYEPLRRLERFEKRGLIDGAENPDPDA